METKFDIIKHQELFETLLELDIRDLAFNLSRKKKKEKLPIINDADKITQNLIKELYSNTIGLNQQQINTYYDKVNKLIDNYFIKYTDDIEHYLNLIGRGELDYFELDNVITFNQYIFIQLQACNSIHNFIQQNSLIVESSFSNYFKQKFFHKVNEFIEYYMIIMPDSEFPVVENKLTILYDKFQSEINNNVTLLTNPQIYLNQLLEITNNTLNSLKKNDLKYNFDNDEYRAFHFFKTKHLENSNKSSLVQVVEKLYLSDPKLRAKYYSINVSEEQINSIKLEFNKIIKKYNTLKISFINNLKVDIEDLISLKSISTKPKIIRNFNSEIFKDERAQIIFYETLSQHKAINENNQPIKRRFLPICDAIFCKQAEFFDQIFTYKLKKYDYITFLENNFNTPIKDKSKLSDGSLHERKVKNFISLSLKKLSEVKA